MNIAARLLQTEVKEGYLVRRLDTATARRFGVHILEGNYLVEQVVTKDGRTLLHLRKQVYKRTRNAHVKQRTWQLLPSQYDERAFEVLKTNA
jgi:hypothetical protein